MQRVLILGGGVCCGSLTWGIGGQAGTHGAGKGWAAVATEDWLYIGGTGQITILRIKGARFVLPDKGLNYRKRQNQNESCNSRLELEVSE